MKKQSLSKNIIFQFLYQLLIFAIPFVVSPYLTRTLQATALGTYTYVNSIAYYFVVLANLGISVHGRRIISVCSDDETLLRQKFWSLFSVHLIISLVAVVCYLLFIVFFVHDDSLVYWIQMIYVLSAMLDVTWFFYGMENFTSVVKRNTAIKILECLFIFSFVRGPEDVYVYTLICSGSLFLGQAVMIPQVIRTVRPVRIYKEDLMEHLKPLLVFSVSLIATTLYTVFDKTLLGIMATKESVAFFEYSNKIVHIPLAFTSIVGSVMLPRVCKLVAQKKVLELRRYLDYSFMIVAFIGVGSCFGLSAISHEFVLLYYGANFIECSNIIVWLAPLVFIIGAGSVYRTQCMIPHHMDRSFNLCILGNACINILLSISLIPYYGLYGAVWGTVGAEVFGLVVQAWLCNRYYDFRKLIKIVVPFLVNGYIMFAFLKFFVCYIDGFIELIVLIVIATIVYTMLMLLNMYFFRKDVFEYVYSAVKR